jgi:glycosyltransferase involved in cell wall biosynthesis
MIRLVLPLRSSPRPCHLDWALHREDDRVDIDAAALRRADVIVVQRFLPLPWAMDTLEQVFALGKPVVYETDDLLTDLPEWNPHLKLGRAAAPGIESVARRASLVTVSTPELARTFARWNPRVEVVPNRVDPELFVASVPAADHRVTIGCTSTPTHEGDIRMIEGAILRALDRFRDRIRIVMMGCATPRLQGVDGVEVLPLVPDYASYAKRLAGLGLDLALVPLVDHPFNRAKSAIKWLEYSVCGVPAIFSDIEPYRAAIEHGRTGWLVGPDEDEWLDAIDRLVRDPWLREDLARRARIQVTSRWCVASPANRLADLCAGLAGVAPEAAECRLSAASR